MVVGMASPSALGKKAFDVAKKEIPKAGQIIKNTATNIGEGVKEAKDRAVISIGKKLSGKDLPNENIASIINLPNGSTASAMNLPKYERYAVLKALAEHKIPKESRQELYETLKNLRDKERIYDWYNREIQPNFSLLPRLKLSYAPLKRFNETINGRSIYDVFKGYGYERNISSIFDEFKLHNPIINRIEKDIALKKGIDLRKKYSSLPNDVFYDYVRNNSGSFYINRNTGEVFQVFGDQYISPEVYKLSPEDAKIQGVDVIGRLLKYRDDRIPAFLRTLESKYSQDPRLPLVSSKDLWKLLEGEKTSIISNVLDKNGVFTRDFKKAFGYSDKDRLVTRALSLKGGSLEDLIDSGVLRSSYRGSAIKEKPIFRASEVPDLDNIKPIYLADSPGYMSPNFAVGDRNMYLAGHGNMGGKDIIVVPKKDVPFRQVGHGGVSFDGISDYGYNTQGRSMSNEAVGGAVSFEEVVPESSKILSSNRINLFQVSPVEEVSEGAYQYIGLPINKVDIAVRKSASRNKDYTDVALDKLHKREIKKLESIISEYFPEKSQIKLVKDAINRSMPKNGEQAYMFRSLLEPDPEDLTKEEYMIIPGDRLEKIRKMLFGDKPIHSKYSSGGKVISQTK